MYIERQWYLSNPFLAAGVAALVVAVAAGWWFGEAPAPVALLALLLAVVLLASLRQRVEVRPAELMVAMWPFWRRTVSLADVEEAWQEEYRWYRYGGWGIRFGGGAVAYAVWGRGAVRLRLRGVKRHLVIGTRDVDGLLASLRAAGVSVKF